MKDLLRFNEVKYGKEDYERFDRERAEKGKKESIVEAEVACWEVGIKERYPADLARIILGE